MRRRLLRAFRSTSSRTLGTCRTWRKRAKSTASSAGSFSCEGELSVKHRKPNRDTGGVGPVDPVSTVRSDFEPVAGAEEPGVGLAGKANSCGASEQQHPLSFLLIVPEAGWARLTL